MQLRQPVKYSETIPFKLIKYILFLEGSIGVVFLVLYIMQLTGNLGIEDGLPQWYFLIMVAIMLAIAVFITNFRKLRIGITSDSFRASFGFIKFEVPLSSVSKVYMDEKRA
jgi:hypothetical protein